MVRERLGTPSQKVQLGRNNLSLSQLLLFFALVAFFVPQVLVINKGYVFKAKKNRFKSFLRFSYCGSNVPYKVIVVHVSRSHIRQTQLT